MCLRLNWRAAALEVDQLSIFVFELQIVVVRDVCGRFLRLAYLCNLEVKGLCWSVQVLFYKIIVFLWGNIFGESKRHSGAHLVIRLGWRLSSKGFIKGESPLALKNFVVLFEIRLVISFQILVCFCLKFRILVWDHVK
jgi:hypothetical protein